METSHSKAAIGAMIGATFLTAAVGAIASARAKQPWYRMLRKSSLNPPNAVFGPVWTTLDALTTLSGVNVYRAQSSPYRTAALAL